MTMASKQHAAQLAKITESQFPPRSVRDSAPPDSPGSTVSHKGSDIADLLEDGDNLHIWSLPTRGDLEKFTAIVEKSFEDITQLKVDTTHVGTRLETLEQRFF